MKQFEVLFIPVKRNWWPFSFLGRMSSALPKNILKSHWGLFVLGKTLQSVQLHSERKRKGATLANINRNIHCKIFVT